jgi:hypothetical protein
MINSSVVALAMVILKKKQLSAKNSKICKAILL